MSVIKPPRSEVKARGISIVEASRWVARAMCTATGRKTARAPVLFMMAEKKVTVPVRARFWPVAEPPLSRSAAKGSVAPASRSARPTTITATTESTASLANPWNTSVVGSTPPSARTTTASKPTTS